VTLSSKPYHDRACQVFISKEPHAGLNASRVDYLIHRHHGSGVKQPSADVFAAEGRVILKEFLVGIQTPTNSSVGAIGQRISARSLEARSEAGRIETTVVCACSLPRTFIRALRAAALTWNQRREQLAAASRSELHRGAAC
jgi:hypothetical protein